MLLYMYFIVVPEETSWDYWAVQVPSHCIVYVHIIMGDYPSTQTPGIPKSFGILGTVETLDGNPGQHSLHVCALILMS